MYVEVDDRLILAWAITVLAGVIAVRLHDRWKRRQEAVHE